MPKPLFSIITCTYNSASDLPQNLKSVAKQNYRDFEHIIIDGYSSDQTWSLARDYAQANNNVIINQAAARGIANAMNLGLKKARGQWLLFLNADDSLNNERVLQEVHDFIEQHPATWYYGQAKYVGDFDRRQNIYPHRWYQRHFFYPLLLWINFINHQATFLHKDLFNKYGLYREDLRGGLDYEYWLRIGKQEKPKFMPILVANFAVGGFSTNPQNKDFNWQEVIKIRGGYTRMATLTVWPMWLYQKIRRIK